MKTLVKAGLGLIFALAAGGIANASPTPYTADATLGTYTHPDDSSASDSGGGLIIRLGSDLTFGGDFDQLQISPVSGSISGDGIYLLNTFDFTVGLNRQAAAGPFNYTFTEPLTIGAVTHNITIPFTVSISSSDTLIFSASDPFYDLGLFTLNIESLPMEPVVNGGGTYSGSIYAQVSGVPEPSTMALLLVSLMSLAGLTFATRRARA